MEAKYGVLPCGVWYINTHAYSRVHTCLCNMQRNMSEAKWKRNVQVLKLKRKHRLPGYIFLPENITGTKEKQKQSIKTYTQGQFQGHENWFDSGE